MADVLIEAEHTDQDETQDKPAQEVVKNVKPSAEEKYENVKAALREERKAREELARQVSEAQARAFELSRIKEDLDQHRKEKQQAQLEKELQENPAAVLWRQQQELKQELDTKFSAVEKQAQDQATIQQFVSAVATQAAAYARENPDYGSAYQFARERRMAEYDALGIPKERQEAVFTEESMRLAYSAMQQGKNPGEMVWNLAQLWGFKPEKESKQESKVEDKLEKIAEGLEKAAGTLSKGAKQDEVSGLQAIEEMSDEEFDTYWKKFAQEAKRSESRR